MLLGEPPRTQWDLHFSLFGIPVRVHPLFWVLSLLLGLPRANDLDAKMTDLVVWVVAVFIAILVHELGHALVARTRGFSPRITLYGMGGLTSYNPGFGGAGTRGEILISAAGPGAGFLLAAVIVVPLALVGPGVEVYFVGGLLPGVGLAGTVGSAVLTQFINDLLFISVFWGIINLLPIYPLDGGQIAREVLLHVNPLEGIRQSLLLSIVTAVMVAVLGLLAMRSFFVALMFGILAYLSYAALQAYRGRGPW